MRLCLDTASKRRMLVSAVEVVKHHLDALRPGGTLAKTVLTGHMVVPVDCLDLLPRELPHWMP